MKKVVALLLAVAMCACLCAHGEGEQPNESQSIPSTGTPAGNESEPGETTTPATESASFTSAVTESVSDQGDDLADLVVSIDGSVYQLPCTVQLLLDDGWQLTSDDQLRTKEKQIYPYNDVQFVLFRGEEDDFRRIYIYAYNYGTSACSINECTAFRIAAINGINDSAEVILAGGFKLNDSLTLDDIIAQYGEGVPEDQLGDIWYMYYFEKGIYTFAIKDNYLTWWSITGY